MRLNQYSIFLFLIFGACVNQQFVEKHNSELPKYEFEQIDSLKVDYLAGNLIISGLSRNGLFLGLDFMDKSVIVFNRSGEISSSFNRIGSDSWAFGNYLYAVGFYNDSTVSILSEKGVFFYSLRGELIKKLLYNDDFTGFQMNSQLQLLPVSIRNNSYLLTLTDFGTDLRPDEQEFYNEAKYFTFINTKTNDRIRAVKPEDNGLYKNGKYFYPDRLCPIFDIDQDNNELKVKYPLGNELYTYSLNEDPKLLRLTNLEPEHMSDPNGVPFDNPDNYKGFSTNGFYSNIYVKHDTTFLFYTTDFDIKKFTKDTGYNFFSNPGGYYNEFSHLYTLNYCQVLVNDNKICEDILLPTKSRLISWVANINYIMLSKQTNSLDFEEDYLTFYTYKLSPVL